MNKKDLNDLYRILYEKAQRLIMPFASASGKYKYRMGFYNGHYARNDNGDYEMEYYPIPVISIINYCDIEVGIDAVSVSTKLSRIEAEVFDYALLEGYEFEAYGIENYLEDYYVKGWTMDAFIQKVKCSDEQDIGFSFIFRDLDGDDIYTFVEFLVANKFFY